MSKVDKKPLIEQYPLSPMFQYYQILLATNIPSPILTYKVLNLELTQGQLVDIPIRGRTVQGVVLENVNANNISYDIDKVQTISQAYSYILPKTSLDLIRIFNLATFNNAGLILETILNPFLNLADKHRNSILEFWKNNQPKQNPQKDYKSVVKPAISVLGNYDFDISLLSRIIYIIRIYNQVDTSTLLNDSKNILIICPEIKVLTSLFDGLKSLINPLDNINLFQYTAKPNQNNRNLIINIMKQWGDYDINSNSPNSNKRVILTTRAGLFLPFGSIDKVILIDEANSNYYQASNSLYYDTRELVLWIQRAYHCSVDFISNFPSIRLRNFDNKGSIGIDLRLKSDKESKPVDIKISHYDSKMTQNRIFGPGVEAILNDEYGNLME